MAWGPPIAIMHLLRDGMRLKVTHQSLAHADPDVLEPREALWRRSGGEDLAAELPRVLRCSK